MSNTYFDMLPYEIIEIIYKKLHNSLMSDLNKEFDRYVDDNKYSQIGWRCMAGECDCECGECDGLGNRWLRNDFDPTALLGPDQVFENYIKFKI